MKIVKLAVPFLLFCSVAVCQTSALSAPSINNAAIPSGAPCLGSNSNSGGAQLIKSTCDGVNVVSAYGADPTGTNDSQTALQNAFNAGGTIIVPPGTYKHSAVLTVGSNTAITCLGSIAPAIFSATDSTNVALDINGATNSSVTGCTFTSAAGARQNSVFAAAILVSGSSNVQVTRNFVTGTFPGPGLFVYSQCASSTSCPGGGATSTNVTFTENTVSNNRSNGSIVYAGSTDIKFYRNNFYSTGDACVETSSSSADSTQVNNVTIEGNTCVSPPSGIQVFSAAGVHIVNNRIISSTSAGGTAIGVQIFDSAYSPKDIQIIDNYVYGTNTSNSSIAVDQASQVTISGNTVENGKGIAIGPDAGDHITIRKNFLNNITVGNGIYAAGNVSTMDVSENTINTVSAGECIAFGNTTAAISDLQINGNHCSGITISSGTNTYGVIDVVGATGVTGEGNTISSYTNAVGPVRFTGTGAGTTPIGFLNNLQIGNATAAPSGTAPKLNLFGDNSTPAFLDITGYAQNGTNNTEGMSFFMLLNSPNQQLGICRTTATSSTPCLRIVSSSTIAIDGYSKDGTTPEVLNIGNSAGTIVGGALQAPMYLTVANCSSSASPAICGSAASGSVVIAASATSVVVDTTAVTANSQIQVTPDASLGTKLGVTCNTTLAAPSVTARTAGTSFTISTAVAPVTNPACYSYTIIN